MTRIARARAVVVAMKASGVTVMAIVAYELVILVYNSLATYIYLKFLRQTRQNYLKIRALKSLSRESRRLRQEEGHLLLVQEHHQFRNHQS